MHIRRHKRFEKQFKRLSPSIQQKTKIVTREFTENPHTQKLKNHALRGKFQGERAISVTGDVRIVFEEENNYEKVTFLRIGTHNQVY